MGTGCMGNNTLREFFEFGDPTLQIPTRKDRLHICSNCYHLFCYERILNPFFHDRHGPDNCNCPIRCGQASPTSKKKFYCCKCSRFEGHYQKTYGFSDLQDLVVQTVNEAVETVVKKDSPEHKAEKKGYWGSPPKTFKRQLPTKVEDWEIFNLIDDSEKLNEFSHLVKVYVDIHTEDLTRVVEKPTWKKPNLFHLICYNDSASVVIYELLFSYFAKKSDVLEVWMNQEKKSCTRIGGKLSIFELVMFQGFRKPEILDYVFDFFSTEREMFSKVVQSSDRILRKVVCTSHSMSDDVLIRYIDLYPGLKEHLFEEKELEGTIRVPNINILHLILDYANNKSDILYTPRIGLIEHYFGQGYLEDPNRFDQFIFLLTSQKFQNSPIFRHEDVRFEAIEESPLEVLLRASVSLELEVDEDGRYLNGTDPNELEKYRSLLWELVFSRSKEENCRVDDQVELRMLYVLILVKKKHEESRRRVDQLVEKLASHWPEYLEEIKKNISDEEIINLVLEKIKN